LQIPTIIIILFAQEKNQAYQKTVNVKQLERDSNEGQSSLSSFTQTASTAKDSGITTTQIQTQLHN